MIDLVLYDHIKANLILTSTLKLGSAENTSPPYTVMNKITDPERPMVLCDEQGESGQAMFQFSRYEGGNQGDASNAAETMSNLNDLKEQVKDIEGIITSGGTSYRIWGNQTSGVIQLGVQALETWGAIFEMRFNWELVSEET